VFQGNFSTKSWVWFGAFSEGIRGIFGVEVERGRFQRSDEARQALLRLIRGTGSFRPVFLIFTAGGKRLRNMRVIIVGDNYQEKA
jgi:hypothetical protein